MIKTEKEYEAALLKQGELKTEQMRLDGDILTYQNKFKVPSFTQLKDLKDFIQCESQEGSLVVYDGITYEVGDLEELESEYGSESVSDGITDADLDQLVDGSIGILRAK